MFRVEKRLYWVADRGRLVRHGDPEAAFLAFTPGQELPDEEARRCGLLVDPEEKTAPAPENKLGARPADKTAVKAPVVKEKTP